MSLIDFPEMWESRVRTNLQDAVSAPWLDGIPELDTNVIEVGSGTASESNIIHIPITTFRPGVLINNTTYPIPLVSYDDTEMIVKLDKYQTNVSTLSDDQINGASYDRIDPCTKAHVDDITESKYAKALHSLSPQQDNGDQVFVIQATGDEVTPGGRRKLLWKDLITARRRCGGQKMKRARRRVVFCEDHVNDLLEDNSSKYSQSLADYLSGTLKGTLAGFEVFSFEFSPRYTVAGVKRAWGEAGLSTDRDATIIFHPENVAKKTGITKQYFADAKTDPETQTNKLNYRHYYIATPVMEKYAGAII